MSGQTIDSSDLFDRCTTTRRLDRGKRVEVRCRLGLWSVETSNLATARAQAKHYWVQYWQDGEYDSLLSNQTLCNNKQKARGE